MNTVYALYGLNLTGYYFLRFGQTKGKENILFYLKYNQRLKAWVGELSPSNRYEPPPPARSSLKGIWKRLYDLGGTPSQDRYEIHTQALRF